VILASLGVHQMLTPLDSLLIRLFDRVQWKNPCGDPFWESTAFRRISCRIRSVLSPQNWST